MKLKIDQDFKSLIDPLSCDELDSLTQSIVETGCRDALVVWKGVLVDGHNRYQICNDHDIAFDVVEMKFADRNEAMLWMINNQLARRNISTYTRGALELKKKPIIAALAKKNQGRRNDIAPTLAQCSPPIQTRDEIAKAAGISHGTLAKIEVIEERGSEEMKAAIKAGEISINESWKRLTNRITHNSGQNEWYTPPEFIEAARRVMKRIDVDPATSEVAQQVVKANRFYTAEENGLDKSWKGRVWLNPPYSKDLITQFVEKLKAELDNGNCTEAIILVNNATETIWFHSVAEYVAAICFVKGRIRFLDMALEAKETPLQGQMILYCGSEADSNSFDLEFSKFGCCFIANV